jgi:pimeloyl-ACP methyl ester carboxylesterase
MGYLLDFRTQNVGGAVVPGHLLQGSLDQLQGERDVVFLLHGFNVSRPKGCVSLGRFAAELPLIQAGAAAVAVLWPGDSWSGPGCYPFEMGNADDTAAELARFIDETLINRPTVSLAAHSLGCRVAMRTVELLRQSGYPVAQVCLLAAAIDNDSLADAQTYRRAAAYTDRVAVLSSECDRVLQYAYPAGNLVQAFLHWQRTSNAALGRTGPRPCGSPPAPVPAQVSGQSVPASCKADHSDYLPSCDPAVAINPNQQAAAKFANTALGAVTPLAYP